MAKKQKRKIRKSAKVGTVSRAAIRKAAKVVMAKRKPQQLKRKYWVSRDPDSHTVYYADAEPVWSEKRNEWTNPDDYAVCDCIDMYEFSNFFGWCPEPGECWEITEIWTDE